MWIATSGRDGFQVVRSAGGRPIRLNAPSTDQAAGPVWSPDGRSIAYSDCVVFGNEGCDRGEGGLDVYVARADGRGRRRLTHEQGAVECVTWAPRSDIQYSGNRGTTFIRPDGSGARRIDAGYGF